METNIYVMDIRQLAPVAERESEHLPPERARKMRAFLRPNDRLRCLAGWLLMSRFLGDRLPERLRYGKYGKPYLPCGPYFNLSHSGSFAVLAVSGAPVGVDVERHREEDCMLLAARAFHPAELDWFRQAPTARNFFNLWTLKESYMKLLGTGLSREPNSFALDCAKENISLPGRHEVRFTLYANALPGYSLSLCTVKGNAPRSIIRTPNVSAKRQTASQTL